MTNSFSNQNPKFVSEVDGSIRWKLIFSVVAVWCIYIAIAFNLGRSMTDTWSLVAVFGALTASFCAVTHSKAVHKNRTRQTANKKREDMLHFFTVGFSLATIQAAIFTFYFAW